MIIEKNIACEDPNVGRNIGTGKTQEYIIGEKIFNSLEIGDSTFLENLNPKFVYIRLMRLNHYYGTFKVYKIRNHGSGGFRIHREKDGGDLDEVRFIKFCSDIYEIEIGKSILITEENIGYTEDKRNSLNYYKRSRELGNYVQDVKRRLKAMSKIKGIWAGRKFTIEEEGTQELMGFRVIRKN